MTVGKADKAAVVAAAAAADDDDDDDKAAAVVVDMDMNPHQYPPHSHIALPSAECGANGQVRDV